MNELMSVAHSIPLGTIVFLLDVEQLFVRVDQGWQEIVVSISNKFREVSQS